MIMWYKARKKWTRNFQTFFFLLLPLIAIILSVSIMLNWFRVLGSAQIDKKCFKLYLIKWTWAHVAVSTDWIGSMNSEIAYQKEFA